jgi:hypothetical protein
VGGGFDVDFGRHDHVFATLLERVLELGNSR